MGQDRSNLIKNSKGLDEQEISLLDFLFFLKNAWKQIGVMAVLGLLIASIYLLITPPQYEAVATIAMSRVSTPNNILGVNVEEPTALIARMSLPGVLDNEVIDACRFEGLSDTTLRLPQSVKFTISKDSVSAVELRVTRPTLELAKTCVSSMVDLIADSQERILGASAVFSHAENMARLATIEERINQDKVLLARADQPRSPLMPVYFDILVDIRELEDERVSLKAKLANNQRHKLQASIEAPNYPVYPRKIKSLIAGVLGGLLLGLLIALVQKIIIKVKDASCDA